ncbi:adventurous gliding motility protein GltJ [Myxococcaceae bacterium GXIMD 01537]
MRFVCDSCRAQYMISDDKIGAKGVKVRCKKCGYVITVRASGATSSKEDAAPATDASATAKGAADSATGFGVPASLGTPPEGGLFTDVEEDEIGAVFDQVLSTGSQKLPTPGEGEPKPADSVRKLAEAEAEPDTGEPKAPVTSHEWYVAIDEKQVGPLSVEKVKDHWERGEVGPDSLCWRSGFSDWIPLSEVADLASVLAPRPSTKPVIVAPAAVTAPPAPAAGPVESAFSAGSGSKSARADSALSGGSAAEEPAPGWKPSAASVLASLVKEENEVLSRPPPKPEPVVETKPASTGLLDLPPAEPMPAPAAPAPLAAARTPAPVMQPQAPAPMQYAPPPQQPVQYAPPGYPNYPPPAMPPPSGNKMGPMIGAVGAVLLLGIGGGVVYMMTRQQPPAPPVGVVATAPETAPTQPGAAPTQPVATRPADPPPVAVPPVAAAQTPPVATPPVAAANPPAGTPAAPVGTPPVAAAGTTAVAATGTPAGAGSTPTAPPVATPPATAPTEVARVDTSRAEGSKSGSSGTKKTTQSGGSRTGSSSDSDTRTASRPSSSSDDDFDELFGTGKKAAAPEQPKRPVTTTYVPPEPGGAKVLEKLAQSDVMQVVLTNKPAILKCVNDHKAKDPGVTGKLVMRWTILTSGKTTAISCQSPEFKSTYMAKCIGDLVKTWTFPKHQKQGEPIMFPFTF